MFVESGCTSADTGWWPWAEKVTVIGPGMKLHPSRVTTVPAGPDGGVNWVDVGTNARSWTYGEENVLHCGPDLVADADSDVLAFRRESAHPAPSL